MDALSISLISIIAGFLLNTLWQLLKESKNRKEKIQQIKEELKSNFHEIHSKKNHIQKIISNLKINKILPGNSVEFVKTYYGTYLKELYPHLSALERNSLHVIYQYFDIIDRMMNNFQSDILNFISLNIFKNQEAVYPIFLSRFEELLQILIKTETLIKEHLGGNPTDVFYINKENKPENLI